MNKSMRITRWHCKGKILNSSDSFITLLLRFLFSLIHFRISFSLLHLQPVTNFFMPVQLFSPSFRFNNPNTGKKNIHRDIENMDHTFHNFGSALLLKFWWIIKPCCLLAVGTLWNHCSRRDVKSWIFHCFPTFFTLMDGATYTWDTRGCSGCVVTFGSITQHIWNLFNLLSNKSTQRAHTSIKAQQLPFYLGRLLKMSQKYEKHTLQYNYWTELCSTGFSDFDIFFHITHCGFHKYLCFDKLYLKKNKKQLH